MDFDMFTRKLGPLPVWGWGAIIGGAFIAWYWYSNAGLESAGSGEEESGVGQVLAPSGDFSTVPVLPEDTEPVVDENTNAEWLVQAVKNAPPGASILAVQAALEKYLNGTNLTAAEGQIVDAIVRKIGLPPQGTAGPPVVGAPEDTPEATKPTNATVTTVSQPGLRAFGKAMSLTIKVDWANPAGHTGKPRGSFILYADDVKRAQGVLINGRGVAVITGLRSYDSLKDKKWVMRVKYVPAGSAEASQSSPVAISFK